MAYQCTQPSLPPPICAQQCVPEAHRPCTCASSCSTNCGAPTGMTYQMKEATLPPPSCLQPYPTECTSAPAPAFVPMCNAAVADPGPAASIEMTSSSSSLPAEQPCLPLVDVMQPHAAGFADPNMAMLSHANTEACAVSYTEATAAHVMPGSIVSLHPSGSIRVRPGPVEGVNFTVGAPMPHSP